ncbi:MAG: peptide-methionine (S)-S-oxide reductase [Candidatus Yanofskybacteria bacterium RIFCSPLOWO2_01_FULL_49_17]|uniref:Peptide methionine sulfoxide reductase MsrA n=1 Tax=Candidatus Yanofskybacteria bacterium RIFCSPLOWO2_01_FULL_49_17 TaxID=1802700 RepID=A0A1F8GTT9_9BACT|nr:MAG: peptide-methionine (S)-S-oxide reductase [Candidatus Yanofskybacteria bacterium RIFCSPLOWO2_01_FULL_49_17]
MKEVIMFGGGCFWCTEAVFSVLKGVISVTPGYAGSDTPNPTYKSVSTDKTGHAEVLKVKYDPEQISIRELSTVFFASHDPTTLNRQGADVGTRYRSIILWTTPEQRERSKKYIGELKNQGIKVVTEVKELGKFFPAEEYHQNYYRNHPDLPYSQVVITSKIEKVQKEFQKLLKNNLK